MASMCAKLRSVISKANLNNIHTKLTQYRQSGYKSSPFVVDLGNVNTKYVVSQSPEEWKYVERLLPPTVVPTPAPKASYPSEWKPQAEDVQNKPYYIARTKNHMIPVYLHTSQRGIRRITVVKKIQGNVWLLERQLRAFLQKDDVRPIRSQVNEFAGYIRFHGDHVNAIKYWLMQRNL